MDISPRSRRERSLSVSSVDTVLSEPAPVAIVRGRSGLVMTADEARLAMETKLFCRFRSLREAYRLIDQDEKGTIRRSAFRRALHEWGIDMSDREYIKFWRTLDRNNDKSLTFSEFCKVVSPGNAMPESKKPLPPRVVPETAHEIRIAVLFDAEIRVANRINQYYGSIGKALASFDRNHNGVIDLDEFRTMLHTCGALITEEEFSMLVDKFDVNGDGCISDTELLSQMEHMCSTVSGRQSVKWSQPSMPRYKSPYRGDLPLLPVAPLDGNMGIMGISDPSGVQSPNGVSIVDKSSEGGQEDGIGDGTSHRVVLTPPHHSQRRRSKRGSGRRSATSSPLGKRHVYVVKEDMARVLKRWGMGFDASSMEPFLRRFTSDHNDTLVDYTEFVMIVAEVLRPGMAADLNRALAPPPDSPKAPYHPIVERIIREHITSQMKSLESAYKRYAADTRAGTLSFKEWVDLCRLLGMNLGEHFWSHMNKRHDLTAAVLTFDEFKRELAEYLAATGRDAAQPPLDSSSKLDETLGSGVASVNVRVARLSLANKIGGNWKALEAALRQADLIGTGKLGEDKFRKIFAGQKVGLSDDNVSALISHYDRDHVGKVYYQDFIKDMEEWLSEGTEIRDLAEEVNMASYYPAGYIPYAYTTATTSTSVADGGGLFSPVRGAQMKAGKGVVFRGRQEQENPVSTTSGGVMLKARPSKSPNPRSNTVGGGGLNVTVPTPPKSVAPILSSPRQQSTKSKATSITGGDGSGGYTTTPGASPVGTSGSKGRSNALGNSGTLGGSHSGTLGKKITLDTIRESFQADGQATPGAVGAKALERIKLLK